MTQGVKGKRISMDAKIGRRNGKDLVTWVLSEKLKPLRSITIRSSKRAPHIPRFHFRTNVSVVL